jgi:predicted nucleic acid-binding protein
MVEVGIAVIAEAELRFGVARKDIRDSKRRWRNSCCGSRFCDGIRQPRNITSLRHALERTGDPMGNLDMMIAAQALSAPAMLVRHDMSSIG